MKVCKDSLDKCQGKVAYEKVTKEQLDIKKLLCNLCWAAIKGHLKIDQVVSTFSDVVVCKKSNPLKIDILKICYVLPYLGFMQ